MSQEEVWAISFDENPDLKRGRPAFQIMLAAFGRLLWMLLYALCSNVGVMTLYRLHNIARFFVRHEYRVRRSLLKRRTRFRRRAYYGMRQFFDPLCQFLMIFSYIRSARSGAEGRIPLRTVLFVVGGKLLYPLRRFAATVLNIAAPVAGVWFLVVTIQTATRQSLGLEVSYNGSVIGRVRSEAQFDEARRRMAERIIDGQLDQPESVSLSLTLTDSFTDLDTMANRMIRFSGMDLFEGYGLYIDGTFVGALSDAMPLLDSLSARLDEAKTGAPGETVAFNRRFSVRSGLYPTTSKTTSEQVEALFSRQLSAEKTYTVQAGDTPIGIASLNGISLDELQRLNPDVLTSLFVGDELTIAHSVPYLRILSQRTETSTEGIPFSTETETDNDKLMGYYEEAQEGEVGLRLVTSRVTYLDDEVISSEVTGSRVLKQPVPKRIVVGGRRPEPSTTGYDTTNDIIEGLGGEMFIWPVDGGKVTMPIWGYYNHTGNDIANIPAGTTIRAAASGVVIYSGYTAGGYGRHIIIQHPNGMQTLYAHNSANYVQVGDEVAQGQSIAAVGQTGNAYGNHCHFEIRQGGQYVDARKYIGSVSPR